MTDLSTQQLYHLACESVARADFPHFKKTILLEGYFTRYYSALAAAGLRRLDEELNTELARIVDNLYQEEHLNQVPEPSAPAGTIDDGRYRDRLLLIIRRASNPVATLDAFYGVVVDMVVGFTRHIQQYAITPPAFGSYAAKVIDLISDPHAAILSMYLPFFHTKARELGLFTCQRDQILSNELNLIAQNPKLKKAKFPTPALHGADPEDSVQLFLGGTYLGPIFFHKLAFEGPEFAIPDETRFSGTWIIAPPGRGKTVLLSCMFLVDLEKDASIIVMDSKGDLIDPIKSMAAIADRLVLIEPDASHPMALNPLDVSSENVAHTIALIEYILSGLLEAKFTNLQSALFRHVLPAIIQAITHPTIEDLKRVLSDGFTAEEHGKLDHRLRQFFDDKTHGFNAKTYAETRSQIIWRLDFILTNDIMRAMFASPTTRLKIADAMNGGKIILIDASKAKLGDDGSEFYQRFFLALILGAAQQRSKLKPSEKVPVYCYLDECQWVRNDQKLATILDECRSQKIALILAHQRTDQIKDPNVLSAMSNCAIRLANSDDEAKYLAPKLRCEPEFLYSLPRGTFAAFVRDVTSSAVALKVPYTDLTELPRMTPTEQQAIRARMREDYGFIPQQKALAVPTAPPVPSAAPSRPSVTVAPAASHSQQHAPDNSESGSTW